MTDTAGEAPAQRGQLTVRDKVVQRIARHAALSVRDVVPSASGLDKVTGNDLPKIAVTVAGGHVRAVLDVAVTWPAPLNQTAAAVRARVGQDLAAQAGLVVDGVDVTVHPVTRAAARGKAQ